MYVMAGMLSSHVMDTSLLVVFRAVAERGSFTAAAAALGYTQSAVSRQVSALESEFGVSLFDRLPRGVRLTESGRSLLPDRKSTRLNSSHYSRSRMPSSA